MDELPDELWYLIFCHLRNPSDIYNSSLVCTKFFNITNDSIIIKKVQSYLKKYKNYYFNYPGSLWLLPMLNQKTFNNFKYQHIRLAKLFGNYVIMIEKESKNVEKIHNLATFAESLPYFHSLEKSFPPIPGGQLRIRYYFNIPKKWKKDFSNLKLRNKGNHMKISHNYKKRILKRYPNINLDLY